MNSRDYKQTLKILYKVFNDLALTFERLFNCIQSFLKKLVIQSSGNNKSTDNIFLFSLEECTGRKYNYAIVFLFLAMHYISYFT